MSSDLLALQNRMKRDPPGYREEFLQQVRHFMSNLQIFKLQPLAKAGRSEGQSAEITGTVVPPKKKGSRGQSTEAPVTQGVIQSRRVQEFCGLISFLSHAAPLYKEEVLSLNIPQELFSFLHQHCEALDPFLRKTLVQAMILLQNRGLVRRIELLPALFRTFRCADKELRKSVFNHIVTDIQKLQKSNPSNGVIIELQKLIFTMLKEDHPGVALKALQVLVELWKRNVWVSDKVVNAISTVCFGTDDKLVSAALYYFLGNYDTADEEEASKRKDTLEKQKELMAVNSSLKHMKRKMKKTRELERKKKQVRQAEDEIFGEPDSDDEDKAPKVIGGNLNPLSLIFDPQHFSERLFSKLKTSRETFATRMLMMEVLSKLIGMHRLLIFNFYPFVQRYLQPHQRHVTQLLAFTARATHSLVPPEVLTPIIKTLANHFVTDRSPPEVMAIGLNAIREICARAPLVMTAELLHDLSEYSHHKNKGIVTAARSLITIFRQLNPALLRRKDRGRDGALSLQIQSGDDAIAQDARALAASKLEYGANYLHRDLDGVDLLKDAGLLTDDVDERDWDNKYDVETDVRLADLESDDPDAGKLSKHQLRALNKKTGRALEKLKNFYREKGFIIPGEKKDESDDDSDDGEMKEMSMEELMADDDEEASAEEDIEGMDEDSMEGMDEDDMDMEDMDMEDMDMEDMEEDVEEEEEEEKVPTKSKDKVANKAAAAAAAASVALKRKASEMSNSAPARPLGTLRILTPADFKRIDALKKKKMLQGLKGDRKRQREMLNEDILAEMDYTVSMVQGNYRELEGEDLNSQYLKKRRLDKASRLARVHEGRDVVMGDRQYVKFGHKVKEDNLGRTNEEKLKSKSFMMVKKSFRIRSKATKSFTDKQSSELKHVKTLRKMSKNVKKKVKGRKA